VEAILKAPHVGAEEFAAPSGERGVLRIENSDFAWIDTVVLDRITTEAAHPGLTSIRHVSILSRVRLRMNEDRYRTHDTRGKLGRLAQSDWRDFPWGVSA